MSGIEFRDFYQYQTARRAGQINDSGSQERGVRLFLTGEGAGAYEQVSLDPKPAVTRVNERLFAVTFPGGIYGEYPGAIQIYAYPREGNAPGEIPTVINYGGDKFTKEDGSFYVPLQMVVKVYGFAGELWQNRNFQPNGAPITSASPPRDLRNIL